MMHFSLIGSVILTTIATVSAGVITVRDGNIPCDGVTKFHLTNKCGIFYPTRYVGLFNRKPEQNTVFTDSAHAETFVLDTNCRLENSAGEHAVTFPQSDLENEISFWSNDTTTQANGASNEDEKLGMYRFLQCQVNADNIITCTFMGEKEELQFSTINAYLGGVMIGPVKKLHGYSAEVIELKVSKI